MPKLLLDFKNAVREGSGQRLATLHKLLVPHLKSFPGFNAYAIEMMIIVIQNEVLLSVAETQCMWASTGGPACFFLPAIIIASAAKKKSLKTFKRWSFSNNFTQGLGLDGEGM